MVEALLFLERVVQLNPLLGLEVLLSPYLL